MRGFSSLPSKASPATRYLAEEIYTERSFRRENPFRENPKPSLGGKPTVPETPLRGKLSFEHTSEYDSLSGLEKKSDFHLCKDRLSDKNLRLPINLNDHRYFAEVLSRKDWYILLNHEFKEKKALLNTHFVVRVLQNQENPLNGIKFYIWVSNIEERLANNQSVRRVLSSTLHRKGPVVLSIELLQEVRSSGCRFTEELLCILISSWGRLGLAKYCAEVFGQISYLGLSPTTRLYNSVIDALGSVQGFILLLQ